MRLRCLTLPALLVFASAGCSDSSDTTAAGTAATATDPAELGGDDAVDEAVLVSTCTADYNTMQVAVETYLAIGGTGPVTEQQLFDEQLLFTDTETFDLMADGSATVVVATPGGACDGVDLSLANDDTMASPETTQGESPCEADRKVMEVALEAYVANGGTLPATEAELVAAGFLRMESDDYDYDGELVVAISDRCADN